MVAHGALDTAEVYPAVLGVSVDGLPRCAATLIDASLALVPASCLLAAPNATLSTTQQEACLRGECGDALAPPPSILLLGGFDRRSAPIVGRVKRVASRFAAWWAMGDACSPALCGEGWDLALLEVDQSCVHGAVPCVPPAAIALHAPAIGDEVHVVGFGHAPNFDDRAEWHLRLAPDGGGVRRAAPARVANVLSGQVVELAPAPGRETLLCAGDLGAAALARPPPPPPPGNGSSSSSSDAADDAAAGDGWRLVSLALTGAAGAAHSGCEVGSLGRSWSTHASRCWVEAALRNWGRPPLVAAFAAECDGHDLYPPEIAPLAAGAAVAAATAADPACATVDCGAHGSCIDGACACRPAYHGPRCTVSGLPRTPTPRANIAVSPDGADVEGCGSARAPCRTLRHALVEQFWDATGAGRADGEAPANVTLLDGTYAGPGNRALELHGVPLAIRSLRGPERVRIDCSPGQMRWGTLFDRGEGGGVTVSGVTLRKCQTESQQHRALATHPDFAVHVAGAARWPEARTGASYVGNVWVSE